MRTHTRGFTVVELLIAVAVLVVVILATARIFGTASTVASVGEANSNMQQTAAAIERVIREDVSRMSPNGFLVLECIAVRNDVNNTGAWPQANQFGGSATAPLLDPTRPATDMIRCDRIVFFTDGFEQTARFVGSQMQAGGNAPGNQQSLASRIYVGHGIQLPSLRPNAAGQRPDPIAFDFTSTNTAAPVVPWSYDAPPAPDLETAYWNVTGGNAGPKTFGSQPEARKWVLARQATLLGDDAGAKRFFNTDNSFGPNAAPAIWSRSFPAPVWSTGQDDSAAYQGFTAMQNLFPDSWITSGRVDIAGSTLDDIQRQARLAANGAVLPWISATGENQWARIRNMAFGPPISGNGGADLAGIWGFPRAEKQAPSMSRLDETLASSVLAGNCSSVEIDWMWADGTGRFEDAGKALKHALNSTTTSVPLTGVVFDPAAGTLWFGMPDGIMPNAQVRGVTSLAGPSGNQSPASANNLMVYVGANVYDSGANQWQPFNGSLLTQAAGAPTAAGIGCPVIPANIEGLTGITRPFGPQVGVWVYTAVFGFNRDQPTIETRAGVPALRDDYTPWPRALRFTLRLHDPRLTVESGRTFQFVVDLPPQTQE